MTSPITPIDGTGNSPDIPSDELILAEAVLTARTAHVAAQTAFTQAGGSTSIGADGIVFRFSNGAQGVASLGG